MQGMSLILSIELSIESSFRNPFLTEYAHVSIGCAGWRFGFGKALSTVEPSSGMVVPLK